MRDRVGQFEAIVDDEIGLRRQACELAIQLPADHGAALRVLDLTRELLGTFVHADLPCLPVRHARS